MSEEKFSAHTVTTQIDLSNPKIKERVKSILDLIIDTQGVMILWLDNPTFTLGAMQNNEIVGVAQVDQDGNFNYFVHPDYQGKGVATQLLNDSIKSAKKNGIPRLMATVETGSGSQRILEKQGFIIVGQDQDNTFLAKKI